MDIRDFLKIPVPPSGIPQWNEWKEQWRTFDARCIPVLIDALANGEYNEQYAALIGLREFGYYAYAVGYEPDRRYEIMAPGATEKTVIVPRIQLLLPDQS